MVGADLVAVLVRERGASERMEHRQARAGTRDSGELDESEDRILEMVEQAGGEDHVARVLAQRELERVGQGEAGRRRDLVAGGDEHLEGQVDPDDGSVRPDRGGEVRDRPPAPHPTSSAVSPGMIAEVGHRTRRTRPRPRRTARSTWRRGIRRTRARRRAFRAGPSVMPGKR